jgi:hypothetical protein
MTTLIGELPKSYCLFASCDSKYLHEHAKEYITSCALANNDVHLHVINASTVDWAYMNLLKIGYNLLYPIGSITVSSEDIDLSYMPEEAKRVYYACNRFLVASQILNKFPIMITDIDCLILKHVTAFDTDVALFFREPMDNGNDWEKEGSRIAAGAVFCQPSARNLLQYAATIIQDNELRWFLDQMALNIAYNQIKDSVTCTKLDSNFMDWEFITGTTIWTGKGPRKYDNPTYVSMKKAYKDKFPNIGTEYWR